MTPIIFLWRSNLKLWTERDNTKEVFAVGHGVEENPDRPCARLDVRDSVHPSAESDSHSSLSPLRIQWRVKMVWPETTALLVFLT